MFRDAKEKSPTGDGRQGKRYAGQSPPAGSDRALPSRAPRILIVEDQAILALQLAAAVEDCGCEVVGPACLVMTALPMALHEQLDAALLDVYLINQTVEPIAKALAHRGIPFGFVTAYSRDHLPAAHRSRPCINEPFTGREVRSLICTLMGMA